ncbi:hypothetical protein SO802_018873 [Lithocarpus litseifolius]|uniref:BURP domain-containing protein n=1 Tax=Lithocarpus litseifolius TaxID=425828 RepID=A0AAW2CRS3_9ROSI
MATTWIANKLFWIVPVTIQNSTSRSVTIHLQHQSLLMNSPCAQLTEADKRQDTIHEQYQSLFMNSIQHKTLEVLFGFDGKGTCEEGTSHHFTRFDTRFNEKLEGLEEVDTTFFIETNLRPGKRMKLHFNTANGATFLPHQVAKFIPFSSDKLPEILNCFSVNEKSEEAKIIKSTIVTCESPCTDREDGLCAKSLKSLVDFIRTKLGKNVQVLSNQVPKETKKQEYRITGVRRINANKGVLCHKKNYAYAVFYCHETHDAGTYMAPLVSSDGTKVNAIATCHTNASVANTFKVLKVKPGTIPICHFLASDTLLWVPNSIEILCPKQQAVMDTAKEVIAPEHVPVTAVLINREMLSLLRSKKKDIAIGVITAATNAGLEIM